MMNHWVKTVFEDLTWGNKNVSEQLRSDIIRIVEIFECSDVHHFRTEDLENMANELYEADNVTELSSLMWKITTTLAFQNFAIFVLKQGPGMAFNPKICTSCNAKWVARYVDQGYQYVDPVMTKASENDGCFLYSELPVGSPVVETFWQDADHHRIGRNGVCFCIARRDGSKIGVSFSTQDTANKVQEIFYANSYDMNFIAQIAADVFCYAATDTLLSDDTLTEAELRFLYVLSTSPNPQDAIKVTSSFGSNTSLQASIRAKLGVETVYQAVARAAARGWFDQLPFTEGDIMKSFPTLQRLEVGQDFLECSAAENDAVKSQ